MALKHDELLPTLLAGIESIKCDCGWEAVFVIPEEHHRMTITLLMHMREQHPNDYPMLTLETH